MSLNIKAMSTHERLLQVGLVSELCTVQACSWFFIKLHPLWRNNKYLRGKKEIRERLEKQSYVWLLFSPILPENHSMTTQNSDLVTFTCVTAILLDETTEIQPRHWFFSHSCTHTKWCYTTNCKTWVYFHTGVMGWSLRNPSLRM